MVANGWRLDGLSQLFAKSPSGIVGSIVADANFDSGQVAGSRLHEDRGDKLAKHLMAPMVGGDANAEDGGDRWIHGGVGWGGVDHGGVDHGGLWKVG